MSTTVVLQKYAPADNIPITVINHPTFLFLIIQYLTIKECFQSFILLSKYYHQFLTSPSNYFILHRLIKKQFGADIFTNNITDLSLIPRLYITKDMIERVFDEFIDPECNGDVDMDEWIMGLLKINVKMNDSQMREVFNIIGKHNEYIDRLDFILFVTLQPKNPHKIVLQQAIIIAVLDSNKYLKNRINLFNPKESLEWSHLFVPNDESEIRQRLIAEIDEEEKFKEESMKHFEDHSEFFDDANPNELNLSTALKWSKFEVCLWVQSLELDACYGKYFADQNIDGEMLIYDIEEHMLISSLGVRPLHAKCIMRALYDLKLCVRVSTDILLDIEHELCEQTIFDIAPLFERRQQLENNYEQALATIEELKRAKDKLKEYYENQLKRTIDELQNKSNIGDVRRKIHQRHR